MINLARCAALGAAALCVCLVPYNAEAKPRIQAEKAVQGFYSARAQTAEPVWQEQADFEGLLVALEGLASHGLSPAQYHLVELQRLRGDVAARDRLATDAWFLAATHMVHGKLNPLTVEPDWTAAGRSRDLGPVLSSALADNTVATSLEQLAPTQPGYQHLRTELQRLRDLQADQPVTIPPGATLRPGDADPRVTQLKQRLAQLELLEAPAEGSSVERAPLFDEATDLAVQRFQFLHGLDVDGVVGPRTTAALNKGNQDLIDRLRVNLERWRWLPDDLGTRHVKVNIPGFSVTRWDGGVAQRTHQAIVGRLFRKTPVFSDRINHVVLNPWWETPSSLARIDKLPLFKRDPAAAERLGFQFLDRSGKVVPTSSIRWTAYSASTFPYRMRQRPGPQNALGQVKIMFPNKHNVYLHDTPDRDLFARHVRAFSSGCIRTEDPLDLTAWLLRDNDGWDRTRIDQVVESGRETRVNLTRAVPVHILYFTIESDATGRIRYLDDIYDRDDAVLVGLNRSPAGVTGAQ